MSVSMIVAYNALRVIGHKGETPWYIPEDLTLFQQVTKGHTVIMGRVTWESITRHRERNAKTTKPWMLPARTNVVLTSQADALTKEWAPKIGDAPLAFMNEVDVRRLAEHAVPEDCFVIGGEKVYRKFIEWGLVGKIYASEVWGSHYGDAYFPTLGDGWKKTVLSHYRDFRFCEYSKTPQDPPPQ